MKIKDWLKENKIFFETATAFFLSLMAIIVSLSQCDISKKQLLLSVDPKIIIEPPSFVAGTVGKFELFVSNIGLSDLYDICIDEDYFVTFTQDDSPVALIRVGPFITVPKTRISRLESNTKIKFEVDINSIRNNMDEFYVNHKNSYEMRFVRLTIKYRRKLDSKEFTHTKLYIIAVGYHALTDYEERGIQSLYKISYDDIKNILGVDN